MRKEPENIPGEIIINFPPANEVNLDIREAIVHPRSIQPAPYPFAIAANGTKSYCN
jgi:hypothetical protein